MNVILIGYIFGIFATAMILGLIDKDEDKENAKPFVAFVWPLVLIMAIIYGGVFWA